MHWRQLDESGDNSSTKASSEPGEIPLSGSDNSGYVSSQSDLTSTLSSVEECNSDTNTSSPEVPSIFKPRSCANIKLFTFFLCILSCINSAITASYLPSIITTLEERFQLGSSISGLIVSSNEIGAVIATVLVSYLGHHRHIPVIIGFGTIIVGLGSVLFSLPHFVTPLYTKAFLLGGDLQNITTSNQTVRYCSPGIEQAIPETETETIDKTAQIALFIAAQTVIGVGGAPILTLGISYVDMHVGKKASSQYLAFIYASAVLGAVVGYGTGSILLNVFVDVFAYSPAFLGLDPNHPAWIGAWWLGFIVFGLAMALISPIFCIFPKSMKESRHEKKKRDLDLNPSEASSTCESVTTEQTVDRPLGKSIKELPRCLLLLLKNPVYMLINLGGLFEMFIVTGFLTFVPKYMETQFDIPKSEASLLTGALAVPGAIIGIVLMGIILKKFKTKLLGAMYSALILGLVALLCLILAFFLGCNNHTLAGLNHPYNSTEMKVGNLTDTCNSQCQCSVNNYHPVCSDGVTYYSLCHAGCIKVIDTNGTEQLSCSCLSENPTESRIVDFSFANSGACHRDCWTKIPYMIMLLVSSFSLAATKTPLTMVTLWCVEKDLRSFGLGIQVVISRLLALLPAPILYGVIIDSSCFWWQVRGGESHNCLIYNIENFRFRFAGLSIGFHLAALMSFLLCTCVIRSDPKKYDLQEEEDDVNERKQNSLTDKELDQKTAPYQAADMITHL